MPATTALIGAGFGFSMQLYINALRKLPILRSACAPLSPPLSLNTPYTPHFLLSICPFCGFVRAKRDGGDVITVGSKETKTPCNIIGCGRSARCEGGRASMHRRNVLFVRSPLGGWILRVSFFGPADGATSTLGRVHRCISAHPARSVRVPHSG